MEKIKAKRQLAMGNEKEEEIEVKAEIIQEVLNKSQSVNEVEDQDDEANDKINALIVQ